MKIVLLDAMTLGEDLDLKELQSFANLKVYKTTHYSEIEERCRDAEIILTNKVVLDKNILERLPRLALICITATGMNNVDLDYAKSAGIEVRNVAGYSTHSVAQHTFSMLLHLISSRGFYDQFVTSGGWEKSEIFTNLDRPFFELNKKKWGIIGLGQIGNQVAKIASAFGAEVSYYSSSGVSRSEIYEQVNLEQLLRESDIISIHAPLNEKTKNLLNKETLSLVKKGSYIINVGRGGIINEDDLVAYIKNKEFYVGLDVVDQEPLSSKSPLKNILEHSHLYVTPHIAWASIEARQKLLSLVCGNIRSFLDSKS